MVAKGISVVSTRASASSPRPKRSRSTPASTSGCSRRVDQRRRPRRRTPPGSPASETAGGLAAQLARPAARGDGDVGGQLQVDGQLARDARGDHAVDLVGRGLRVGEDGRVGRHLLEDVELQVVAGDEVMDHGAGLAAPGRRGAADEDQRHLLGVGAGHGVQDAEAADAVGDHGGAGAVQAGVAVGGVPGVQLVAGADPLRGGWRRRRRGSPARSRRGRRRRAGCRSRAGA